MLGKFQGLIMSEGLGGEVRSKDYQGALDSIAEYERYPDACGVLKEDLESVEKRKERLEKRLGIESAERE